MLEPDAARAAVFLETVGCLLEIRLLAVRQMPAVWVHAPGYETRSNRHTITAGEAGPRDGHEAQTCADAQQYRARDRVRGVVLSTSLLLAAAVRRPAAR